MWVLHQPLITIFLLSLLAACSSPHISQEDLEAELVKQRPNFDKLIIAIEKYKQNKGTYPLTLSEFKIEDIPRISLPAEFKSLRADFPQYELSRDQSFYRLTYAVSDTDNDDIYAAAGYISYTKQWHINWDPEPFLWLEINHFGALYQSQHTGRYLDLTVQSLLNASLNSAHRCTNFWDEWLVKALGIGSDKPAFPVLSDKGNIKIYPAQDTGVAYAFITREKVFLPTHRAIPMVTGIYYSKNRSSGWQLLQTCVAQD